MRVVIVGAGFAGLNVAKRLGGEPGFDVRLIDRENHHLFQLLLYQVATAGLSPAEIAEPTRSILAGHDNVSVLRAQADSVDLERRELRAGAKVIPYDRLVVACGAVPSYFGHREWERFASPLKTLEDATAIRRKILTAFEHAEGEDDPEERRRMQTFVVVGAGSTGVELAGAIGEVSRYTLVRDFRRIDPRDTRIVVVEGADAVLPGFPAELGRHAAATLEALGVEIRLSSPVTAIGRDGVEIGDERIRAATVLWAAGVGASPFGERLGAERDRGGRVHVEADLSLPGHPEVFVAGDLARFEHGLDEPLPGLAAVAQQQGRWIAANLRREREGKERLPFEYRDRGRMATIGRRRAVIDAGRWRMRGFPAWILWVVVHIYALTGFRNRLFVLAQWIWSYFTHHRGARLILGRDGDR